MTIKVCKEKTLSALAKIGKVISKSLQLFFLSWIFIGIYWILIGFEPILGALSIFFGGLFTFVLVPMIRGMINDAYETILHDINGTLKLFKWNEDC